MSPEEPEVILDSKQSAALKDATNISKKGRALIGTLAMSRTGRPNKTQRLSLQETKEVREWRNKELWRMRHEDGMSVPEIARISGLNLGHVYDILRKMKIAKLRTQAQYKMDLEF